MQSPKSDIFVVLLGVALGAMVLGCLFLILVLNQYGFSRKVSSRESSQPTIAVVEGHSRVQGLSISV